MSLIDHSLPHGTDAGAIRLFNDLEPARLLQCLEMLTKYPRAKQPGPNHDGEWTGVSLYSKNGQHDTADANTGSQPYVPTSALHEAPYIKEVLDRIPAPKHCVRLLALPPRATIRQHRDLDISLQSGKARLHAPITTHPDVEFLLGGHRQHWKVGELWFGDFTKPHSVKNNSPITRYHLVIDVAVTSDFLTLLPQAFVEERRSRGGIALLGTRLALSEAELRQYECAFTVGEHVRHLNDDARPVICEVKAEKQSLNIWKMSRHHRTFEPTGIEEFTMVGAPAGVKLRFQREQGRVRQVTYEVTGVPIDGMMADPIELEDRRWRLPLLGVTNGSEPE